MASVRGILNIQSLNELTYENMVYASREVLAFSDKNSVFSDVTRKLVKGLDENV